MKGHEFLVTQKYKSDGLGVELTRKVNVFIKSDDIKMVMPFPNDDKKAILVADRGQFDVEESYEEVLKRIRD